MQTENCNNCPVHNLNNLEKLGINMAEFDFVVALAGNPNTGKSTVFNNLTGLRQHTGNWPGKTVTRAEGGFEYNEKKYKLVDLPGTYSLLSTSADEEVARNFILFGQPDVTVVVVDGTRLERNLNLVLQILEISNRVVLCVNFMDEVRRLKLKILERVLAKKLGVIVVPMEARQKKGMDELLAAIEEVALSKIISRSYKFKNVTPELERAVTQLSDDLLIEFPDLPNTRWIALRLLEGDQSIIDAVRSGELNNLMITQRESRLSGETA